MLALFSASLGDICGIDFSPGSQVTRIRHVSYILESFPPSVPEAADKPRQRERAWERSAELMVEPDYRMDSVFATPATRTSAYETPSWRRNHEAFAQSRHRNINMGEHGGAVQETEVYVLTRNARQKLFTYMHK